MVNKMYVECLFTSPNFIIMSNKGGSNEGITPLASTLISYEMLIHNRTKADETRARRKIAWTLTRLAIMEGGVSEMKVADDVVESDIVPRRVLDYLHQHERVGEYGEFDFCILPPASRKNGAGGGAAGRNCTSTTGLVYIYLSHFSR